MENDKYYTPEIEEFHVGFEFEEEFREEWNKLSRPPENLPYKFIKLQFDTSHSISRITNKIKLGKVRVKKLDQEDIESLGWKPIITKSIGKNHYEGLFENTTCGKMIFEHDFFNEKVTIKHPNYIRDASGNFDGYIIYVYKLYIKNKSELRRLMKQLGINI